MEEKTLKQLNLHYWGTLATLAAFFALAISNIAGSQETLHTWGLTVEMYAVVITLVIIPIALKTFADRLKKIRKNAPRKPETIRQYKTAYFIRLYALAFVAGANIILYALSRNMNFFWLAALLFVIFLFCKSSEKEIFSVTDNEDASEKQKG